MTALLGAGVLLGAGKTLKSLLDAAVAASPHPELPHVPTTLASPREVRSTATTRPVAALSQWLYRVQRSPGVLNEPRGARASLDLFYLVTPICESAEGEQALLGMVLKTLDDNPILAGALLAAPLDPASDELRVLPEAVPLEQITRLWNALDEPYRLSMSYRVQLVHDTSAYRAAETGISPSCAKKTT